MVMPLANISIQMYEP